MKIQNRTIIIDPYEHPTIRTHENITFFRADYEGDIETSGIVTIFEESNVKKVTCSNYALRLTHSNVKELMLKAPAEELVQNSDPLMAQLEKLCYDNMIELQSNKIIIKGSQKKNDQSLTCGGKRLMVLHPKNLVVKVEKTDMLFTLLLGEFTLSASSEQEFCSTITHVMEKIQLNNLVSELKNVCDQGYIHLEKDKISIEENLFVEKSYTSPDLKFVTIECYPDKKLARSSFDSSFTLKLKDRTNGKEIVIRAKSEDELSKAIDQVLKQSPQAVYLSDTTTVDTIVFEKPGIVQPYGKAFVANVISGTILKAK